MNPIASQHAVLAHTTRGVATGTAVMTADGALPVEHLSCGDRIVTRAGLRPLRGIGTEVVERATLVCIARDTLGTGRPTGDALVAPGQPILIRDWRAKALFGTAQALIPAARLVDGILIHFQTLRGARLFTLHFDSAEVIYAGGLELGCTPELVSA